MTGSRNFKRAGYTLTSEKTVKRHSTHRENSMSTIYLLQTNARTSSLRFLAIALPMFAILALMLVDISVGGAPDLSLYGTALP